MTRHPLFEAAKRTPIPAGDLGPRNAVYNLRRGAWVDSDSGELVILRLGEEPPRTKKNDVETGEDQKGY